MSDRPAPSPALLHELLAAEFDVLGRMPWASNGTFLVEFCDASLDPAPLAARDDAHAAGNAGGDNGGRDRRDDATVDGTSDARGVDDIDAVDGSGRGGGDHEPSEPNRRRAIYKPARGERPLWDFPAGLYRRETAAYELSAALGWHVVPPTVVREGPLGTGSVQLFIDAEFEHHYFTLAEVAEHRKDFERICVFDVIANNTDRKSGHCLLGKDGRIWAIDNGLCFAAEFKLRTVIWDFGGEPIPDDLVEDVGRLAAGPLPPALCELLEPEERTALRKRLHAVADTGRFPVDRSGRRYPWPLV